MKPLCPNCLSEMSRAAASRNLFSCEPCREIVQFFGISPDDSDAGPHLWLPIRRTREAPAARVA